VVFLAILESPLQGFFGKNCGFSGDSRIASTGFFGELGVSESGELFTEQNPL
jgi:hypothetical protein